MNLRNIKHRHRHVLLGVFVTALLGASTNLYAEAGDISFAGFASLVYGKALSDPDKVDGNGPEREGNTIEGYTQDGDYREDTNLGLRMDADLGNDVKVAAQVVAYGADDYDPTFDWIYAAIELTPEVTFTIGKSRVPMFMYSDYQDVSYAYQWIRPPSSVYAVPTFQSFDGVQLGYSTDIGSWVSELTVWGGSIDEPVTQNGLDTQLHVDEMVGIAWQVERDWLTMRAIYAEAVSSVDIESNEDGAKLVSLIGIVESIMLNTYGEKVDLLDDVLWEDDESRFYGVGIGLNFEKIFFQAEVTETEVDHSLVIGDLRGAYAMLGYRLTDKWTFSVTYQEDFNRTKQEVLNQYIEGASTALATDPDIIQQNNGSYSDQNGVDQFSIVSPSLQYPDDPDRGQLTPNGINDAAEIGVLIDQALIDFQHLETEIYIYGVRWDFHQSASLKFEYITEERLVGETKTSPNAFRVGLNLIF